MTLRRQKILETGIYALIWAMIVAIPLFTYNGEESMRSRELTRFWLELVPFAVLFLVNNYLLIPKLLLKKRYAAYAIVVVAAIMLLFTVPHLTRKNYLPNHRPHREQFHQGRPAIPGNPDHSGPQFDKHPDTDAPLRAFMDAEKDGFVPPDALKRPPPRGPRPLLFRWWPMLSDWLLAILMVSFNIAIKYVFKSFRDEQRLKELENENLISGLNYLKAQINPHFFMNTLNNIHALIGIDSDRARSSVIELSRIMRYVLYDTDKAMVPLQKEIEFVENYVSLMKIRHTEDVEITTSYPEDVSGISIPPMMLVTLVENAFKHGISYDRRSYVTAELSLAGDMLAYTVRNSIAAMNTLTQGVGLENLRKRLGLLYGDGFILEARRTEDEYTATLSIPVL